MSSLLLAHARRMCRGFGSVPISGAGVPAGTRGLFDRRDAPTLDAETNAHYYARIEELRVPGDELTALADGDPVTVDGRAYRVRGDGLLEDDGATRVFVLAQVRG